MMIRLLVLLLDTIIILGTCLGIQDGREQKEAEILSSTISENTLE
jgi:hypothetical protein